ncbi:MAG TPA: TrkA C-terminal domain-containing protein [Sedimentisphaerales bacterium]|nr:TrkA C-terminal domain-containing protein [Sedimentisphaerales bacterium]
MNPILFITVLIVSFIVVRTGAVAFHLTGLEWSMAKFQALSCFTATGFTTREAELVTGNRQRRRIASILIVLGHAGLVTMIATFANSIQASTEGWSIPFLPAHIHPKLLPWINLAIIVVAIYVIFKLFTNVKFVHRATNALRERLIKGEVIERVSFEELAIATGGYGVSKIQVCKDSPVLDKTLIESKLRSLGIIVLAIVRGGETIASPVADTRILLADELVCFGKLGEIRDKVCKMSEPPDKKADNK